MPLDSRRNPDEPVPQRVMLLVQVKGALSPRLSRQFGRESPWGDGRHATNAVMSARTSSPYTAWRGLAGGLLWTTLILGVLAVHGLGSHNEGDEPATVGQSTSTQASIHGSHDHVAPAGERSNDPIPHAGHSGPPIVLAALLIAALIWICFALVYLRAASSDLARSRMFFAVLPRRVHPPPLSRLAVMRN